MNVGAPQGYDLPLISGLTNAAGERSVYWRNQFGEVSFIVYAVSSVSIVSASDAATLPVGFRPAYLGLFHTSTMTSGGVRTGGSSLNVNANGEIRFHGPDIVAGITIWGSGTFLAAQ